MMNDAIFNMNTRAVMRMSYKLQRALDGCVGHKRYNSHNWHIHVEDRSETASNLTENEAQS